MKSLPGNVRCARLLWVFGIFFLIQPLFASDTNHWDVQVTGLRVIAPAAHGKNNFNAALMSPPGVAVELRLTPPHGYIVNINQFDSKLDSFTDNKGTDLLATKSENPFSKSGFGMMDSKQTNATVDVEAAGLPTKGATALNISGKVVLNLATGTKQFTLENLDMKPKTTFNLGDMPVMISNVGTNRNQWMAKKYKYAVTFSSLRDLKTISKLEFFDSQGTEIKGYESMRSSGPMGSSLEYGMNQKVDHVKMIATCWQGLETIEVPISVSTGLGL